MREIARDLYMITLPMPFRLEHVNVFVLAGEDGAVLFDTGLNIPESINLLDTCLASIGLSSSDIRHIYLTHFHADHCSCAGILKERSGAVIHMSDRDSAHLIRVRDEEDRMVAVTTQFLSRHGLPEKTIAMIQRIFGMFRKVTAPFDVDEIVIPGETVIGGRPATAILTPGHAPGHMCYYFPGEGVLLSGDHVLPDITPNIGPDLFDPSYHPLEAFLDSLARVRDLPVSLVCPAHGIPFPDLAKRVDEITEHHHVRKDLILDALRREPRTTYGIAQDIFEGELSEFDSFLALNETFVHLVELVAEGFVKESSVDRHIRYSPA